MIDQNSVSHPTDRGRVGAIYALVAVITFLDDLGCIDEGLRPVSLMRLLAALQDTDNGKTHPMLVPKKLGHRRDSLELKELKMQAALAMQLLMDSGLIESEKVQLQKWQNFCVKSRSPFRAFPAIQPRRLWRRGEIRFAQRPISNAASRPFRRPTSRPATWPITHLLP